MVVQSATSEDEAMEPRFDMFGNEIGAKFSKRFASTSMVIAQSPLPKVHPGTGRAAGQPDQRLRLVRQPAHQGGRGGG